MLWPDLTHDTLGTTVSHTVYPTLPVSTVQAQRPTKYRYAPLLLVPIPAGDHQIERPF